jgi:hypothetical protein
VLTLNFEDESKKTVARNGEQTLSDGLVEVNIRAVRAALLVRAALRVRTRGYDLPSARER